MKKDQKNKNKRYILIVDASGEISSLLSLAFPKEETVLVVVGKIELTKIPKITELPFSMICVVYQGEKKVQNIFPQLLSKAQEQRAQFLYICYRSSIDTSLINTVVSTYRNSSVFILGELFGKKTALSSENNFNKLIHKAATTGKIHLEDHGIERVYPVYDEDALNLIAQNISQKKPGVFFLFPKHPTTLLSIARIIHAREPTLKIDFVSLAKERSDEDKIKLPGTGQFLLPDTYAVSEKVQEVYRYFVIHPRISEEKKAGTKQVPYFLYIFLSVCGFLFIPLIVAAIFLSLGFWGLFNTKTLLDKGEIGKAQSAALLSKSFFSIASESSQVSQQEFLLIGQQRYIESLIKSIAIGKKVSQALTSVTSGALQVKKVLDGGADSSESLVRAVEDVKQGLSLVEGVLAEYGNDHPAQLNHLFTLLSKHQKFFQLITNTIETAPYLSGLSQKRIYLVLFQNNMELRPGGGFIGSYGLLTLDKGRIIDFSIHDVYDADGQLKGHVEPPFAIRRYLPSVHWYLRDSNFSIHWPDAASNAAQLLNLETGTKVDGVIGVDISFVKKLLKAVGPVYVSEYNETVNEENLFLLTEKHAEKNTFPGSSQKKDFLRSLFNAINLNFSLKKNVSYSYLLEALETSIREKHVLLGFADASIQHLFGLQKASSSLTNKQKDTDVAIDDFLGLNEANLGVNKANYFLKRAITQQVSINEEGQITEKIKIQYKNTSTAWPGGDYKDYVRIVVPEGSELLSIEIDGNKQEIVSAVTDPKIYEAKGFIPPSGLEVEKSVLYDKTIFGFLHTVLAGSYQTITISYTLPMSVPVGRKSVYGLEVFKQPGTEEDNYSLHISYPPAVKIIDNQHLFNIQNNSAEFMGKLTQDLNFNVIAMQ